MNRIQKLAAGMLTLIVTLFPAAPASAQIEISTSDAKAVAHSIADKYTDWSTVAIDGKLEMDRLPLSPSLKIFMERGKVTVVSVRAPFIGEVGRAQIKNDEVLVVNKLKKVYVQERLGDLLTDLPVGMADIQGLLLGRAFVAGSGQLSTSNCSKCEFYSIDKGWLVIPNEPIGGTVDYGFQFDSDFRMNFASAVPESIDAMATAEYGYGKNGKTTVDIELTFRGKDYQARLNLNKPQYGAKPMGDIDLDSRYRKVTVKEFFNSLKF